MATFMDELRDRIVALHENRLFQAAVISVIVFSALVIGANTYEISPQTRQVITVLDFGVTLFFLAAFVFLNMMIGVVLDVMQREHLAIDMGRMEDGSEPDATAEDILAKRLERIESKLDELLEQDGGRPG